MRPISMVPAFVAWAAAAGALADPPRVRPAAALDMGAVRFRSDWQATFASLRYNSQSRREELTGSERRTDLATALDLRWGWGGGLESRVTLPLSFHISSYPVGSTLPRASGGGVGDLLVELKWQLPGPADAAWAAALTAGLKWPTGRWSPLDPTLRGTDQLGTGTRDAFVGFSWGMRLGALEGFVDASFVSTLPREDRDASGAVALTNLDDLLRFDVSARWDLSPALKPGLGLLHESSGPDTQWWAGILYLEWRPHPASCLVPRLEFPVRGVNHLSLLTFGLEFQQQF